MTRSRETGVGGELGGRGGNSGRGVRKEGNQFALIDKVDLDLDYS